MVSTEDHFNLAKSLVPHSEVLKSALKFRTETYNLIEQCIADCKTILIIGQNHDETYRFNCRIV